MEIKKVLLPQEKLKPLFEDALKLEFGKIFTDYMFKMQYNQEHGWHEAEISPYRDICLDPAAIVFHYSQEVFEGQKAYLSPQDEILLFRPLENARRLNRTLRRLCMAEVPEDIFLQAEEQLLRLEKRWIPKQKGASLYIRPTVIATEPGLGVRPSGEYLFFIILTPVGPYFKTGFNPVSLMVTKDYVRAAKGGTGEVKVGGNYAASLYATEIARERGYGQVLWLDAKEHRYIEEVGSMNIAFVINGQLITPSLSGSILPGITRMSVLELATEMGLSPVERMVTIDEVISAIDSGELTEAFGMGTATIIAPVGKILYEDREYLINNFQTGPYAKKFFDTLTGIQYGELNDKHNWLYKIN